jgi:hypothetical protein
MKHLKYLPATIALFLAATSAIAAPDMQKTGAQKSFDAVKSLQGNWEGTDSDGRPVNVSFTSTANNSAVLSEIRSDKHGMDMMVTMFHMDGPDRLLMTHYCSAGNQPRMAATASADGKTIAFEYQDATNLVPADAGHMQRLVITITDDGHHIEEWHFVDHGKEIVQRFDLARKS